MSEPATNQGPDSGRRGRLQRACAVIKRSAQTVTEELDVALELVEGALPADLRGVLFRNGPGRMERGGAPYQHPFDGDGMVTRFAFDAGGVRYRNRFVRTREYLAEEAADRMLYRGFGTNLPGGLRRNLLRMRFKNAANTSVVVQGGMLLALWEGGLPHRLDPETLATVGRHDFGGQLKTRGLASLLTPELPFSAHPKRDGADGTLHNFATLTGRKNTLLLYQIAPDGSLAAIQRLPLARLPFVHDFVLTQHYRAFYLAPVSFDAVAFLLGLKPPALAMRNDDGREGEILLVPRDGGPALHYPAAGGFIFHFANGYEDSGGRVLIDGPRSVRFPELQNFIDAEAMDKGNHEPPLLTRFTVAPGKGVEAMEVLSDHPLELPTINPARAGKSYRYVYAIGNRPGAELPLLRGLVKVDIEGRRALHRDFGDDLPGEPVFVPRAGATADAASGDEDDGYLLSLVYRAATHTSELLVLSARDLNLLARLRLPHHVPPGFHGTFVPAT